MLRIRDIKKILTTNLRRDACTHTTRQSCSSDQSNCLLLWHLARPLIRSSSSRQHSLDDLWLSWCTRPLRHWPTAATAWLLCWLSIQSIWGPKQLRSSYTLGSLQDHQGLMSAVRLDTTRCMLVLRLLRSAFLSCISTGLD